LLDKIRYYFSLERPVLGGRDAGVERQLILFTGVAAGSVGQWLFAGFQNNSFPLGGLVVGLIASIVTFPAIFYNAGLNQAEMNFVKWCTAFQSGFFWPALLEQVGKGFQGTGS
jgi:hypothetical protein